MEKKEFKVSGGSNPASVAGAIASYFRDKKLKGEDVSQHVVTLVSIGAGAVNQATKALGIAKGYVAASNLRLMFDVGFVDLDVDGAERTAIEHIVTARIG